MGCSPSDVEEKKVEKKEIPLKHSENLHKEREVLMLNKKKIDSISNKDPEVFNKKFDSFKLAIRNNNEEEINNFLNNYKDHFSKETMDKDSLIKIALDSLAEEILPSEFQIKDWKIHTIIYEVILDICDNLEEMKLANFKKLLEIFENEYPKIQKGILYDIPSTKDNIIDTMNKHLKINDKFNNLQLINFQFKSNNENEKIYIDISEIIKFNVNLITIVIFYKFIEFDNNPENQKNFDKFSLILESIYSHPNLKSLLLNFENSREVLLPEKVFLGLQEVIKKSQLIAIFLNNIFLNDENIKKFLACIYSNSKLKFLAINFINKINTHIELFIKAFSASKSLHTIFISGGDLNQENIDLLYSRCKNIQVLEYRTSIE